MKNAPIQDAKQHAEREFNETRDALRRAAVELAAKMGKFVAELDKEHRGEPALRPSFAGEAGDLARQVDRLCTVLEIRREHVRAWAWVEKESSTPPHE